VKRDVRPGERGRRADDFISQGTVVRKAGLLLTFLFVFGSGAAGQTKAQPSGTIVEQMPCAPRPVATYEQYVEQRKTQMTRELEQSAAAGFSREMPPDFAQRLLTRDEFIERQAYSGSDCQRIKYSSDGLKVVGFIWKPRTTAGKKLPLVIFNRGGNREFSKLTPWMKFGFYDYVANGFVVIGSQYRGNDGGEGTEEFGGADVRDVLNLIPLARSLGYVDMNNVFMLGVSRGGMMTLLALKNAVPVNAAAIQGGLADLVSSKDQRRDMLDVFKELIPDFGKHGDEALRDRSAVYWPAAINVPLLVLQGGADWRVDPRTNALALAQKLQEAGKTYELTVYAGDDHGLSLNTADADRRVLAWFKRYMR
jgi:dipeptidyl aminopeptidase/acylaminoacyl peptidase